jgi:hypothetical protein
VCRCLADLLELCVEEVTGALGDARMQGVILRVAERVRGLQAVAAGISVETPKT